jgi:hypothetical protein
MTPPRDQGERTRIETPSAALDEGDAASPLAEPAYAPEDR